MKAPPGPSPWILAGEPASLGDPSEVVTLVEGRAFCVCTRSGDVHPGSPQGVFFQDVRVVSGMRLLVDGAPIEPLVVAPSGSFSATFVGWTRPPEGAGRRLLVTRRRTLGVVLLERIEVQSWSSEPVRAVVTLDLAVDFADVFAVKESRVQPEGEHSVQVLPDGIHHRWTMEDVRRDVLIHVDGDVPEVGPDGVRWDVTVPPGGRVTLAWEVGVGFGGGVHRAEIARSVRTSRARFEEWSARAPVVATDHVALARAYRRSVADLGALRLFDPAGRHRPVIAAGAPWFMTLFGRDSLLTSYLALPLDPELALGVLQALAELQGDETDPKTEEEPGRILHEARYGGSNDPSFTGGVPYFGSVDATPLFVVLLGELHRWGLPTELLAPLVRHADRALAWVEDYGDRDGDGFVEYQRASPRGLANQAWKDSWDGVRYHDGRVATSPLALCEVQGYVYAAYRARARLAVHLGDGALAARLERRAGRLREAFNDRFWDERHGWFAMAIGPAGELVDACASNMGHCLWSGIVDPSLASRVAEVLLGDGMWSGWGVRTLSRDEPAFDPTSYHCGSVWPHDSTIAALGLARYGFVDGAHRVVAGLLDAADRLDGRLPELFCGLSRGDLDVPVPFPTSCSPQAWSSAGPVAFVRLLLGLEPDLPGGTVGFQPALLPGMAELHVTGCWLWDRQIDVTVDPAGSSIRGLPPGIVIDGRQTSSERDRADSTRS